MEGVRGMTSAMAVVYRYCISPGQMATLHQELEMAQHFFDIITLRYKNRYTINIDVEEQLLKRPIPKMTLQPILENTFLHGMVGIESGGTVVIKGHVAADGATIISVSDNGHGIESKTMNNLNEELSDADVINFNKHGESRIGIHNVNSRIRLIFGEEYGIILKSNKPQGLCVIIRLGQSIKLYESQLTDALSLSVFLLHSLNYVKSLSNSFCVIFSTTYNAHGV